MVSNLGGDSGKVILGGFSQGSSLALWSLFTGAVASTGRLGVFIGLSAWMPFIEKQKKQSQWNIRIRIPVHCRKLRALMDTCLQILGLDASVTLNKLDECLHHMPVYPGHGTDVRKAKLTFDID